MNTPIRMLVTPMEQCLVMGPPFSPACRVFVVDTVSPKGSRMYPKWFRASWVNSKILEQNREILEGYMSSRGVTLPAFEVFFSRTMSVPKTAKSGMLYTEEYEFFSLLRQEKLYDRGSFPTLKKYFPQRSDLVQWFESHVIKGVRGILPKDLPDKYISGTYILESMVAIDGDSVTLSLRIYTGCLGRDAGFESNHFMEPFLKSMEEDPIFPKLRVTYRDYRDEWWSGPSVCLLFEFRGR